MSLPLTTTFILPINKKTVKYILSWTNVIIYNISLKSSLFFNSFTLFMYSNNIVIYNHCNIVIRLFVSRCNTETLSAYNLYLFICKRIFFYIFYFQGFYFIWIFRKIPFKIFCASNKCHCSITFII